MPISRWTKSWLSPAVVLAFLLGGCGPAVPREQLGEPVFEIPKVPGAEEPYRLPPEADAPPQPNPEP